ncbi:PLP-dependent transferase, partial [Candidatus Pacearchaeota archaeon]|nr:PLP-dependent transferase [Candidatus Pacearchaeota archaeon]
MSHSLETVFVRGGERPDYLTGALAPVLYRSKTYAQNFGEKAEFEYSRGNNPTRNVLEEKLAALEGGGKATVFSSGLAAETMLFLNLEPGDHIIIPKEVYGGTTRLLRQVFAQYGITYSSCDFSSEDSIARKVQKNTRYLF